MVHNFHGGTPRAAQLCKSLAMTRVTAAVWTAMDRVRPSRSVILWLEHEGTEALWAEEPSDGGVAGSRRLGGREGGVTGRGG